MTEPSVQVLPVIDEQTQNALQPPCEAYEGECGESARWAIRLRCSGCGRLVIVLFCAAHKDELVARGDEQMRDLLCGTYARVAVESVEPIR